MNDNVWRTGRKVFRTIYLNDHLVGMMDTAELASKAVCALNGERDKILVDALKEITGQRVTIKHRPPIAIALEALKTHHELVSN